MLSAAHRSGKPALGLAFAAVTLASLAGAAHADGRRPRGSACPPPAHHAPAYHKPADDCDPRGPKSSRRALERAWEDFGDDCLYDALTEFARVARREPWDAEPRVGYALASALRGDDRGAVWSMRRAFRADPEGARIPRGRDVERQTERVLDCYVERTEHRPRHARRGERGDDRYDEPRRRSAARADDFFMLAATAYLLGDLDLARCAIDDAIAEGDCDESARNLRDLLCR